MADDMDGKAPVGSRLTVDLDIPRTAEEREQRQLHAWDKWYDTLPADLRAKMSLHDFKRLGDCFKHAFGVDKIMLPPDSSRNFDWSAIAELRQR